MIGERVLRVEDRRLLTGTGRFVGDIDLPHQVWLRMVRSHVAHGCIRHIDVSAARSSPGVVAAVTASDLPAYRIPVRVNLPLADVDPYLQPILATDRVRYVGEPVAAILATDQYAAEDAADRVVIDIEPLAVVLDIDEDEGVEGRPRPPLFVEGNVAARFTTSFGDVEAAFTGAAHRVAIDVHVGRHSAVPLECRGLVAAWDAGRRHLDVWGGTKVPNWNRLVIADFLGVPHDAVRMHSGDAGGGFGVRGELYPEDLLVCWAAVELGVPVKWIEDRAEHLVAANHSRQQRHRLEAAFDTAGTLLGLRARIDQDNGAYVRTHGVAVAELTAAMLAGPYRVPAFRADVMVGLTNKTPCGTYRAPGRYEGTYAREQLLDVAATRLGMPAHELREHNLLVPAELPLERDITAIGTPMVIDDSDFGAALRRAVDCTDAWKEDLDAIKARGQLAGVGLAMFLEKSGFGPHDSGEVRVEPSGRVIVYTGATSLGQGAETVVAQIVADDLGVAIGDIDVRLADTAHVPFGGGSFASRSTVVGGSAVHLAGNAVADRARAVAADRLEAAPSDVVLAGGTAHVVGSTQPAVPLRELAAACGPGGTHFDPERPGLAATRIFSVDHMTYPYGAHVALVAIDPRTGESEVVRYAVIYEVGRAVNPMMLEGQLIGGVVQGIGGALLEEFAYDENGQPVATTFMDYLLPTVHDMPAVETMILEDKPAVSNPLGVKGGGEGGITAVGAAVAGAVRDALGLIGPVPRLPITPELVLELLATSSKTS